MGARSRQPIALAGWLAFCAVVFFACQTVYAPPGPYRVQLPWSEADSAIAPDSAVWSSPWETGFAKMAGPTNHRSVYLDLKYPLEQDTIFLQTWTLGIRTGGLTCAAGISEALATIVSKPDTLGRSLLVDFSGWRSLRQDSLSKPTVENLRRFYALRLFEGAAPYAGFPGRTPTGIDPDSARTQAVVLAARSGSAMFQILSKWIVDLDSTGVRKQVLRLLAGAILSPRDTVAIFRAPVRAYGTLSIPDLQPGGAPVAGTGTYSWNQGLACEVRVTVLGAGGIDSSVHVRWSQPAPGDTSWSADSLWIRYSGTIAATDTLVVEIADKLGRYKVVERRTFRLAGVPVQPAPAPRLERIEPVPDTVRIPWTQDSLPLAWRVRNWREATIVQSISVRFYGRKLDDSTFGGSAFLAEGAGPVRLGMVVEGPGGLADSGYVVAFRAMRPLEPAPILRRTAPVAANVKLSETQDSLDLEWFLDNWRSVAVDTVVYTGFQGRRLSDSTYGGRVAVSQGASGLRMGLRVLAKSGKQDSASIQVSRDAPIPKVPGVRLVRLSTGDMCVAPVESTQIVVSWQIVDSADINLAKVLIDGSPALRGTGDAWRAAIGLPAPGGARLARLLVVRKNGDTIRDSISVFRARDSLAPIIHALAGSRRVAWDTTHATVSWEWTDNMGTATSSSPGVACDPTTRICHLDRALEVGTNIFAIELADPSGNPAIDTQRIERNPDTTRPWLVRVSGNFDTAVATGSPDLVYVWAVGDDSHTEKATVDGVQVPVVAGSLRYTTHLVEGLNLLLLDVRDASGNHRYDTARIRVGDWTPVHRLSGPSQVGFVDTLACSSVCDSIFWSLDTLPWTRYSGPLRLDRSGTWWAKGYPGGVVSRIQVESPVAGRISTGASNSFLLAGDTTWATGAKLFGRTMDPVFGFTQSYVGIATATGSVGSTYLVTKNGDLFAAGDNQFGQLGLGDDAGRSAFALAVSGTASVAPGGKHVIVLKKDNTAWGAGSTISGQLGWVSSLSTTSLSLLDSHVVAIGAGMSATWLLEADGTLFAAGANDSGQFGWATDSVLQGFAVVDSHVVGIATMSETDNAFYLKGGGDLYAVGDPSIRLFGAVPNKGTPVKVASGVSSVCVGLDFAAYVDASSRMFVVGGDLAGRVGPERGMAVFHPVEAGSGIAEVHCGTSHLLYKGVDGRIWVSGSNAAGQLGIDGGTGSHDATRLDGTATWLRGPVLSF